MGHSRIHLINVIFDRLARFMQSKYVNSGYRQPSFTYFFTYLLESLTKQFRSRERARVKDTRAIRILLKHCVRITSSKKGEKYVLSASQPSLFVPPKTFPLT